MALAIFLPYDGYSSLSNEVSEIESAEFVLGPAAAMALVVLGVSAFGMWQRWGGAVVLTAGALGAVHFASLVLAAALAVGEPGDVRIAGFVGVVGGVAAALAGLAVLRASASRATASPTAGPSSATGL